VVVMTIVGIVVTNHPAIVTRVEAVVIVGQVVSSDMLCEFINPDFAAQLPITGFV